MKNVGVGLFKVNILYIERLAVRVADISVAVTNEIKGITQLLEVCLTSNMTEVVDDFINIIVGEVMVFAP